MKLCHFLLIQVFIISLAACKPQTNQQKETSTSDSVISIDTNAVLDKRPGPEAARSVPDRLVRALYFEHNQTDNPFRVTTGRATIDQFFEKSLADRIWKQVQQSKKTNLNGLFNLPDAGITKTWVLPAAVIGSKAAVYVTYNLKDKPAEIRVDLAEINKRWQITDMLYADGKRLSQLLPK